MCGRTTLIVTPEELERTFGYEAPSDYRARYNIAPSQTLLALDGSERFRQYRWGLIPAWADDPSVGSRMINARSESAFEKPAFRDAMQARRCLIIADGYYEWRSELGGKQPYRACRTDGEPFTFAGVWERWQRGAEAIESCAILTTSSNDLNSPIHDRMPVIVEPSFRKVWLHPDADQAELEELLRSRDTPGMEVYPVSSYVNDVAHDDPECIEAVAGPPQLTLEGF